MLADERAPCTEVLLKENLYIGKRIPWAPLVCDVLALSFRYIRSNANTHTGIVISPMFTAFRARPDNSWKLLTSPVSGLTATISASTMAESRCMLSVDICIIVATTSGYLSSVSNSKEWQPNLRSLYLSYLQDVLRIF